jgi:hypothetical protein
MPNIVKLQNALSQEIEANGPNTETAQQIRDAITKSTSGITSSVRTQAQKRDIFNTAREEIARVGSMPDRYLGAMGDATILKDIGHYNLATDPIKKKEIGDNLVRAAVSDKIAPEYAMVQVGAQGNNLTVEAGKQQEKAIKQGWPKFYKRYLNNLPRELQAKAKEEHDRLIQQLNEATGNSYSNMINPYLSNKTQSGLRKEKNTTDNKGKYTGFMNGKKYSIPENKIKEFMSAGGDISE